MPVSNLKFLKFEIAENLDSSQACAAHPANQPSASI
jgi:hypothetical protein